MTATEIFQVVAGSWGPLFVITSMFALGLSLTRAQIKQPLVNVCRVVDRP